MSDGLPPDPSPGHVPPGLHADSRHVGGTADNVLFCDAPKVRLCDLAT